MGRDELTENEQDLIKDSGIDNKEKLAEITYKVCGLGSYMKNRIILSINGFTRIWTYSWNAGKPDDAYNDPCKLVFYSIRIRLTRF